MREHQSALRGLQITLEDLLRCNVGHTVVSMLIDINGFWSYDDREQEQEEDGDQEQEQE